MVPIKSFQVVEVHYGQDADHSCHEVCTIETSKHVCYTLECDKRLGQTEPIGMPPSHFLDCFIHILVYCLINELLFYFVNLWILLLEFISLYCFFFDKVKSQADISFSLSLKVKKSIRPLKLVQIPLNVIVVIYIFLQLGPPFTSLLLIHEILTVHIVEVNSHLWAVLVWLIIWRLLILQVKVEPQLLDFDRQVIHILPELFHHDIGFYARTQDLRVDDLDVYPVVIVKNVKLDPLVVYRIFIDLSLCLC